MVIAAILIFISLILTLASIYMAFIEKDDEKGSELLIYAVLLDLVGSIFLIVSEGF